MVTLAILAHVMEKDREEEVEEEEEEGEMRGGEMMERCGGRKGRKERKRQG